MRTITVVTATRAEYGLLRPVVQKIAASDVLDLQLVVTGAHLCPRLGETVHEIEADGLPIAARLPIFTDNADEPVAKTIARTMEIFDNHFAAHRPDAVLLLGDRFEIFAVAAAAAARHIPIAHISGGDVTLGAADEYYRHCISKMAAVHFPSCADSAARLVRMGEAPDTVFCVGGLGDENIRTLPKMSREELCKSTGFDLMQPFDSAFLLKMPRLVGPGVKLMPVAAVGQRLMDMEIAGQQLRPCVGFKTHAHNEVSLCGCRVRASPWGRSCPRSGLMRGESTVLPAAGQSRKLCPHPASVGASATFSRRRRLFNKNALTCSKLPSAKLP